MVELRQFDQREVARRIDRIDQAFGHDSDVVAGQFVDDRNAALVQP
jgi:hypothetical protein